MKHLGINLAAMAMLVLVAGAGCKTTSTGETEMTCPIQRLGNAPPDELSTTPLVVDAAMQLRDWSRSTAFYSNGDTIAGPTGFWYEPTWNQVPDWIYTIEETPLFVGQTIILPVTMWFPPPWSEMRYTGVTTEPTYTAMPVLPWTTAMTVEEPVAAPVSAAPQQ